jgi:hypothetical protein
LSFNTAQLRKGASLTVGMIAVAIGAHRNDHDDHHNNNQCGRQCRWWLPRKAWFSGWCRTR